MKKHIVLILLLLFVATVTSGCFFYRQDRDRGGRHGDDRHVDEPLLQVNVH